MAPQSTTTNGLFARALASWMACATSSLPVPVSPVTSTVRSVGAAFFSRSKTPRIDGALPDQRAEAGDVRHLDLLGPTG